MFVESHDVRSWGCNLFQVSDGKGSNYLLEPKDKNNSIYGLEVHDSSQDLVVTFFQSLAISAISTLFFSRKPAQNGTLPKFNSSPLKS